MSDDATLQPAAKRPKKVSEIELFLIIKKKHFICINKPKTYLPDMAKNVR